MNNKLVIDVDVIF